MDLLSGQSFPWLSNTPQLTRHSADRKIKLIRRADADTAAVAYVAAKTCGSIKERSGWWEVRRMKA
jgi:hypothetical protein